MIGLLSMHVSATEPADSVACIQQEIEDEKVFPFIHVVSEPVQPDSADVARFEKKSFWRAAGETVGFNIGLWAFDRYALKGHYAYINWNTIKENFKHGFDWDDDHLNTNMFAHPYNGSLFYNAGRSNGYNFWQSELFAIGGSAMWELFMECEYPSTNDIIATPIGGAALGEVFYRTSDLILDDRTKGWERFGRETAAFLISPMRGFTRIVTGQAWEKRPTSGRRFGMPPISINFSAGTRLLAFHNEDKLAKFGGIAQIDITYGDRFASSKTPYDYFSFHGELNLMPTQPLLSRIEIQGRLLSRELVDSRKYNLSLGMYQHFDFFDSDTISLQTPGNPFKPCNVPYKLGSPASIGSGLMFKYDNDPQWMVDAYTHLNGVILGGILSDYYRFYHRNYNWASGFSLKFGANLTLFQKKLSASISSQYYRLYTWDSYDHTVDWSATPSGKPVDVQGDNSKTSFIHTEARINYKLWKNVFATLCLNNYFRRTDYYMFMNYGNWGTNQLIINSHQTDIMLMLSYVF